MLPVRASWPRSSTSRDRGQRHVVRFSFQARLPTAWQRKLFEWHAPRLGRDDSRSSEASCRARLQASKTPETQGEIEKQIRQTGNEVEYQHPPDRGEIGEWNEANLRGDRQRNVEPRTGDPRPCRVQRPQCADQRVNHGTTDHEKKLAVEVAVFTAEDEKEFVRKERGCCNNRCAEGSDRANCAGELPSETAWALTTCKSRRENIGEQICQNGEDHGETSKRADFGNRRDA